MATNAEEITEAHNNRLRMRNQEVDFMMTPPLGYHPCFSQLVPGFGY